MTVVWYVENIKIPYKEPGKLTTMIPYLQLIYGKIMVKCGKNHTYIDMDIGLINEGLAKICMSVYIDEAVEEFPEVVSTPVSTPASDHLF